MRIGIDVRYLSHGLVGGVHTFMANFIPALLGLTVDHEVFLYADTKRSFELTDVPRHVQVRLLPWTSPLSSIYHDLFMSRAMEKDRLDIAHFAGNYGFGPAAVKTVVTLQDEINLMPLIEIWRGHRKTPDVVGMMTYLHFCTQAAVRRADRVITISEYSKRQIARYGRLNPEQIVPVPHGCPYDIRRVEDPAVLADVRQRLGLARPFILAEAFKNPGVIVRAWRALPRDVRERYQIVFFSRSPEVLPVVHDAIAVGDALLFVRPARADLSALYCLAEAFVFPSWIEGFGIPLVEAMTCGAPVICSDRGAIPEVVGEAALIMDAEDDRALLDYLLRLFEYPEERVRLQQLGYVRAAKFTWHNAAQRVLDLYTTLDPIQQ
jgi:glycosyltransferase involved in cell wall biosynthesis